MDSYNELIESLRSMEPMVCSTAADAIEALQSRVAELESRLEISPLHNVDGIMARDATIKLQDERIAELEAERAEREKQEPIGRIFFPKHRKAPDVHWADNTPILEGAAIYAAPPVTAPPEPIVCETCQGSGKIDERLGGYNFSNPSATCPDCDGLEEIEPIHDSRVTAPVRLTDDQVERALRTNGAYESDAAYAMAKDGLLTDARAIESAALRANGFKVEE